MAAEPENVSTETAVIENHKISVSFSRKLNDGNYGGTEATAWVQGDIDPTVGPSERSMALANLFTAAKAAVLDELGIAWSCDDEGIVRETATPYVSTQHAQAAVGRVLGGTPEQGGGDNGGIRVMNQGKPEASSDPLPQWLIDECKRLGITAVWDKRGSRQGQQPYFTEAIARGSEGQGHGKDGAAKAFWPPK